MGTTPAARSHHANALFKLSVPAITGPNLPDNQCMVTIIECQCTYHHWPRDDLDLHREVFMEDFRGTIMYREFKIFCCPVIYSATTQREHLKACQVGGFSTRNRPMMSKRRGKKILLVCTGKLKSIVAVSNCHIVVTTPDRKNPAHLLLEMS